MNTTHPICCGIMGQYNDMIYLFVYGGFWKINGLLPINPITIQNVWVPLPFNVDLTLNVATVADHFIYFYQEQTTSFGYFDMRFENYTFISSDNSPLEATASPCVTYSQRNIILIGGTTNNGITVLDKTLFVNLDELEWIFGPKLQIGRLSFGCSPFECKNGAIFLYVFGGFNSQNTIEKINITDISSNVLNTQTWNIINQKPTSYNNLERAGIQIIVHLQKISLLGGFSVSECLGAVCAYRSLNYVDILDPYNNDSIVNIPGLNDQKFASIYGIIGNRIYSFGGLWYSNPNNPNEDATILRTLERSNLLTSSPTNLPTKTPTNIPSDYPTRIPNMLTIPTEAPTTTPSLIPTNVPSDFVTKIPTMLAIPTEAPTLIPTNMPSDSPTRIPAMAIPTEAPTTTPSLIPTGNGSETTSLTSTHSDIKPTNSFRQYMPWIITSIVAIVCLSMCIVVVSFYLYVNRNSFINQDVQDIEIIHQGNNKQSENNSLNSIHNDKINKKTTFTEQNQSSDSLYSTQITVRPHTNGPNMYNGNIHAIIHNNIKQNKGNKSVKHGEPSPAMSVSVNRIKKRRHYISQKYKLHQSQYQ